MPKEQPSDDPEADPGFSVEPNHPDAEVSASSASRSDGPSEIVQVTQFVAKSHHGPLPDPETLEGYERVVPGSAERIITMAEEQARHRRALEWTTVKGGSVRAYLGLAAGTLMGLVAMILGFVLIREDRAVWGFATIVLYAATLGGVYVAGQASARKERVEKAAVAPAPVAIPEPPHLEEAHQRKPPAASS